MSSAPRLAVGIALTLGGWLLTRASARAWRPRRPLAWAFDLLVPALMFAAVLAVSVRPLLAGVVAGGGLAAVSVADRAKRRFLGEPVVFTDLGVLPELVRHSELYIAFVGYGRILGGAAAAAAALAALVWLEPPLVPWPPLAAAGAAAGVVALLALGAGLLVRPLAFILRGFAVTGDPVEDSAALGLCGMQFVHGVVTRADRPARRARLAPPATPAAPALWRGAGGPPVVLAQLESFFDPARLGPAFALPEWDALAAGAQLRGRLQVPGLGGNTMRTEFEILTGRGGADLGLDRLHPYQAFCRRPVDSLAWRLKARGYRTVAIHPYDRRFYGRDRALPNLGFDRFLGAEAFEGVRRNGRYIADDAVAELALRVMAEEGPSVFVFLITMGAHGPWESSPEIAAPGAPPEAACGLGDWRGRIADTGRALELLSGELDRRGEGGLGLYGDHMPSLPALWDALAWPDRRTDFLFWRPGGGPAARADLAARELGDRFLAVLDGEN